VLVEPLGRKHSLDDVFENVGVKLVVADGLSVLAGDDHGVDASGLAALVVLHRDLALAVGPQVGQLAVLAHQAELAGKLVGHRDGGRHQLGGLVDGVSEHHALVAGAAGVNTLRDVARLFVDRRNHCEGVGVESVEGVVVADRGDDAADQALKVNVGLGGDFAGDDHEAGSGQRFSCYATVRVLFETGVQDGIGDLVGNFVGMTFRDRFRGKQKTIAQLSIPPH